MGNIHLVYLISDQYFSCCMETALGCSRKSSSASALAVPALSSLITFPDSRNSEMSQVLYADNFAGEVER